MKRPCIIALALALALSQNSCQWLSMKLGFRDDPNKRTVPRSQRGEIDDIEIDQVFLRQQAGKACLLDARPWFFYQLGHLPGAIHINASDCDPRIEELKPVLDEAVASGKTLIVYCNGFGCKDARTVSRHLIRYGYDVSTFGGGWKEWKKAELPVESASHAPPESATSPAP